MRRAFALFLLLGGGCFADGIPASQAPDDPPAVDPVPAEATACSVSAAVFQPYCVACHKPNAQRPDLSFEALPTAIAEGDIVPSDANGSPLYRKIAGNPVAGGPMPPGGALTPELVTLVEAWIAEGASLDCEPTTSTVTPQRHHPDGWAEPAMHGTAMKLGLQPCNDCHGSGLDGRLGPSCDSCHQPQWRTTCTYCHGGTDNETGAPPRDLSGTTATADLTFIAHTAHVAGPRHPAYDCITCHEKPTDVLSLGHAFDDTPGRAEVAIADGDYEGGGRCANLYCHGNGQTPGAVSHDDGPRGCNDCHAGPNAGRDIWDTMSGEHADHLREGVECVDCHGATVDAANTIATDANHVDGQVQLSFSAATLTRSNGTCSGTCHMQAHDAETWRP